MTSVAVLERFSIVCPLGVRLRDEATGEPVRDSLSVVVYPASQPELRTSGVPNHSGVFVFRNLPGLRELENGSGDAAWWAAQITRFPFMLEVRDLSGRYLPFRLPVQLPQRRILSLDLSSTPPLQGGGEDGSLPLFSSPTRATPDGMGVLRAELLDSGTLQPASWAVIEATAGQQRLLRGMADREGRVMLPLFYPRPVISLGSPGTGNTPLTQQTWAVDFTVRYRRREPVPEIPDLADVLAQPAATVLEQTSPLAPWTRATLQFGRELRAALLITPAGSPP